MAIESIGSPGSLPAIFSFSFLVALTGAASPGPLLTYTIVRSAAARRGGHLMGLWIIAGHAVLEAAVIVSLLLGFSLVLRQGVVVRAIGLTGGLLLVCFGGSILLNLRRGRGSSLPADPGEGTRIGGRLENPFLGGILVSMSNPYWWVWWATIGLAFMIQFRISFSHWPGLLAFFLGHEAGDLAWYLGVSILSAWGLKRLGGTAYRLVLACCGLFMILFGLYLGLSPLLYAPPTGP